jgi:hypothetical protein
MTRSLHRDSDMRRFSLIPAPGSRAAVSREPTLAAPPGLL